MYGDDDKLAYGPDKDAPTVRSSGGHIMYPAMSGQPQAPIPPGTNLITPGLPGPAYNSPPPGGSVASPTTPDSAWQQFGTQQGAWSPNLPAPGGTAGSAPASQLARPMSGYGAPGVAGWPQQEAITSWGAAQPWGAPQAGERWEGGGGFQFLMLPDQRIQVVVSPPGKPVGQMHGPGSAGWAAIVAEYERIKGSGALRSQQTAPAGGFFQQALQQLPQVVQALRPPPFQPSAASYTPPPPPPPDLPVPEEKPGMHPAVYVVGGLAALAALGGLVWWMSSGSSGDDDRKKNPSGDDQPDDDGPAPSEDA